MNVTALAPGQLLWGRHRKGLLAVAGAWLLGLAGAWLLPDGPRESWLFACAHVVLPLSLVYLVPVFAFGFDGLPLEGRESSYPARLFTLPVGTVALVAWPMLSGGLAMAVVWGAWAGLVLRPHGLAVPLVWPAVLLAAAMAWLQALLWTPFGWPYLRLAFAMIAAGVFIVVAVVGTLLPASDVWLGVGYLALLGPAYLAAYRGVRLGRHGDGPDWSRPATGTASPAALLPPFRSPALAQTWFERGSHGWVSLLLLLFLFAAATTSNALVVLPLRDGLTASERLAVLFPFSREATTVFLMFSPLAIYPVFLVATLGTDMGRLGATGQPSPFLLTRPVPTADLIHPKMGLPARLTLVFCGLMAVAAGAGLLLPGAAAIVAEWWRQVLQTYSPPRAWAMAGLAAVAMPGMLWLQMCQGFVFGVSGRLAARLVPLVVVAALVVGGAASQWAWTAWGEPDGFWGMLSWLIVAAVAAKFAALAWVLRWVTAQRLWPARTMLAVLAVWLTTAGSLIVLAWWLIPAEVVPLPHVTLAVVAMTPLTRVLSSVLVLDRTRHG